ncbi:hypothetical protein DPMN_057001 [Dreissena polymorpha]|uniref:Uncharacterized protein n=1 Tax=Dreissena polymorpha TaxID=45954 RepID=A0A9D4CTL9_DREPO|nr:hypothetical protein DPMN_057001 [Dreissena polymorpha]
MRAITQVEECQTDRVRSKQEGNGRCLTRIRSWSRAKLRPTVVPRWSHRECLPDKQRADVGHEREAGYHLYAAESHEGLTEE